MFSIKKNACILSSILLFTLHSTEKKDIISVSGLPLSKETLNEKGRRTETFKTIGYSDNPNHATLGTKYEQRPSGKVKKSWWSEVYDHGITRLPRSKTYISIGGVRINLDPNNPERSRSITRQIERFNFALLFIKNKQDERTKKHTVNVMDVRWLQNPIQDTDCAGLVLVAKNRENWFVVPLSEEWGVKITKNLLEISRLNITQDEKDKRTKTIYAELAGRFFYNAHEDQEFDLRDAL